MPGRAFCLPCLLLALCELCGGARAQQQRNRAQPPAFSVARATLPPGAAGTAAGRASWRSPGRPN